MYHVQEITEEIADKVISGYNNNKYLKFNSDLLLVRYVLTAVTALD